MHGEIWRRSKALVVMLVGEVQDRGEVRLPDLVRFGSELEDPKVPGRRPWSAKTVENTVRDLTSFGVFRVVQRGRDRVYSMTVLGEAWIRGAGLPSPARWGDLQSIVEDMLADDVELGEGPERIVRLERAIGEGCPDRHLPYVLGPGWAEAVRAVEP